mmetsp:Transcript_126588/g.405227  ORF Transcript_126588/g.405227 Transcript_126588/m.405227 type:complete len:1035 (+) Transcript_126588:101-3205(+)
MQEIHAWRSPSGAGGAGAPKPSGGGGGEDGEDPNVASQTFFQKRCLGHDEGLVDGFRDAGGGRDPCDGGGGGGAPVLVLDRAADSRLAEFCENASKYLQRGGDAVTRLMVAALLVSEALGRSGDKQAVDLEQRGEDLSLERMDVSSGVVLLGLLLAEKRGAAGKQAGAGGAWHRSVLLKALCDWFSLAPCALHRGASGASSWNIVHMGDGRYLVDVMFDPGAMYEEGSARAVAYLEHLQKGTRMKSKAAGRGAVAPSVEAGVKGKMVRPSWHVEPWEVDFQRSDRAGRGGFGEVFRGTWSGQLVAIKEVRDTSPSDMEVCQFILEISLLSGLSHPNIVRFWRGCVDLRSGSRTLLLVTEWMDRGVLSELLHEMQEPVLTAAQSLALAVAIARGMEYLHEVGILHLDLKSPNVLLSSSFLVKVCDFGLAKVREQVGVHTTLRGVSPVWAPPEMFDESAGGISEKADVYSFGIILFELFTRQVPFSELSQMQLTRAKSKGQLPKFPPGLDADIADVIRLFLPHRPGARPTARGAIAQLRQLAKQRNIDLAKVKAQMESEGLNVGGQSGGSGPRSEQSKKLEAETREAEAEINRLKKQLQDEETKLRLLEEQIRQKIFQPGADGDGQKRLSAFCGANTEKLAEMKFRCNLCMKLFRGENFAHKHILDRHFSEMLASLGDGGDCSAAASSPVATPGAAGSAAGLGQGGQQEGDTFFDTDIAEETNARTYTDRLAHEASGSAGASGVALSLQDAARNGDLEKVRQCIQQGAPLGSTDTDGNTALHLGALAGRADVARYLLEQQADAEARNDSGACALHSAAQEGHVQVCQVLLEAGVAVDMQETTRSRRPLHLAASGGHYDVCAALLAHKAAVNARDSDGLDALHNAARAGHAALCELALSWGASVNAPDDDGWTALHEAARWGDAELVGTLLARGADLLAMSNDGEGPLHVVPGGYAEADVVDALLESRADINAGDYDGETPLHVAVRLGDDGLTGAFLAGGADANARTKAGATPLDLARKDEIKWLLRSHKARRGTG